MSQEYPLLDVKSIPSLLLSQDFTAFVRRITPEIAQDILDHYNYKDNRNVNIGKVSELMVVMNDDTFAPDTTTINFSIDSEDEIILTDGQHRLKALFDTEKTYNFPILVTKTKSKKIYPKTDRGNARGIHDAIKSFRVASRLGISATGAKAAASGLRVVMNGHMMKSHSKVSEDYLLNSLINDYKEIIKRILDVLYSLEFSTKLMGRTPMSLWLTLYKELSKDEWDTIDDFIYGCATHDGLSEDDPRRWVYLMYTKYVRSGGGSTPYRIPMSRSDELRMLLTAWNFWYHKKISKRSFQQRTMKSISTSSPNVAGTNITYTFG